MVYKPKKTAPYYIRIQRFEAEKNRLSPKLTHKEYEREIKRLAQKYQI